MYLVVTRAEVRQYIANSLEESGWYDELNTVSHEAKLELLDGLLEDLWDGIYEGGSWLEDAVIGEIEDNVRHFIGLRIEEAPND